VDVAHRGADLLVAVTLDVFQEKSSSRPSRWSSARRRNGSPDGLGGAVEQLFELCANSGRWSPC